MTRCRLAVLLSITACAGARREPAGAPPQGATFVAQKTDGGIEVRNADGLLYKVAGFDITQARPPLEYPAFFAAVAVLARP